MEADLPTRNYIESLTSNPYIKVVAISDTQSKLTLGELRNISVREADGEYVCVWDDDNWYGSNRLNPKILIFVTIFIPPCYSC
jgi:glycosyltransferase involved in cell wall biosynthesis